MRPHILFLRLRSIATPNEEYISRMPMMKIDTMRRLIVNFSANLQDAVTIRRKFRWLANLACVGDYKADINIPMVTVTHISMEK